MKAVSYHLTVNVYENVYRNDYRKANDGYN